MEPPAGMVLLLGYQTVAPQAGVQPTTSTAVLGEIHNRHRFIGISGGGWCYFTQRSPYSIGNALNTQELWSSAGVIKELKLLLEGDQEEARAMVKCIRQHMVEDYKRWFWDMVCMEMEEFAGKSYFGNQPTVDLKRRVIVREE